MTDVAINPPVAERTPEQTERVAWSVLLLSFTVFCAICLASGIGIYYFLFQSTVSMDTELTVARGTTIVTGADLDERPVQGSRTNFDRRSMIRTDSVGQAMLTFYDQVAIATLTLNSSTSFVMEAFTRPRFEWSTTDYVIDLQQVSGRLDIVISGSTSPVVRINLKTADGTLVQLVENGRYSINANAVQVRVEAFSGTAQITSGEVQQTLSAGERVMYNLSANERIPLSPYVRLLGTSAFDETNVFASTPPVSASAWECFNRANDNVLGNYGLVVEDGRSLLHLSRFGSHQHGETNCITSQGGSSIDVTGYEFLAAEVLFRIDSQSLSACGEEGSECPLMLRIDYRPATGGDATFWSHGFYLWNSQPAYPLSCSTCTSEHEIVNTGVWYRYRSDNLFGVLVADKRPGQIVAMWVYASGHAYDVYVSDVSLLANENTDPIPVGDPSLGG